ncbi:hypothetical protein SAMN04490355_103423 [Pelosinus propionicus DSM 13327]|nr:hypothetical protein SAMN04490355_103423 [Pelosinus propionicus DSM 13327]
MERYKSNLKELGEQMNIHELHQIKNVALLVGVIYLLKFLGIVEA